MNQEERCRQFSAECIRLALQTANPSDKASLLEMARLWQERAEYLARSAGG